MSHTRHGCDIVRDNRCPICSVTAKYSRASGGEILLIECDACGSYALSATAATVIPRWEYPEEKWAAVSYEIRRIADRPDNGVVLTNQLLKDIFERAVLPRPPEGLDGFVIWLAAHSRWPGEPHRIQFPHYRSIFGAVDIDAFNAYLKWLIETGWITGINAGTLDSGAAVIDAKLSPSGWKRYAELTSSGKYSRDAFMAMPFNNPEIDAVFKDYFVPAAERAGFKLRRNVDAQPAGLIDDVMRVQIRTSRFVVAELTHHNRGSYWEAGFAEGLSKPVIYTCRADIFEHHDLAQRTHFDTNHLATVVWKPDAMPDAAKRLTAMIRSTLPSEAKLHDD
jgi:hypothetical protein